jgi:methionine-R-sulfoxide reductase
MINYAYILNLIEKGDTSISPEKVVRTDEEWKSILESEVYYVTRQKGTEAPTTSGLCYLFEPGIYACTCCGTELFDNNSKFDSGTGWPSFTEPIRDGVLAYHADTTHNMERIEVLCRICDAHLGHVFPDGPEPTGLRYCMNGIALRKK